MADAVNRLGRTTPSAIAAYAAHHTAYVVNGAPPPRVGGDDQDLHLYGVVTSGRADAPTMAPAGSAPIWPAVNPVTHSVYIVNEEDSSVSVLDTSVCNASTSAGCPKTPPAMAIDFDGGGIDVDPATDTVYAASQDYNTVSVLDGARCNARRTSGCTAFAPTTPVKILPQGVAVNRATAYVANRDDGTVSVINIRACSANHDSGCEQTWPTIAVGDAPQGVAVDRATDTVYTADGFNGENTVSVIDARSCNVATTSGCSKIPAKTTAGSGAFAVTINEATHTIYVANRVDNTVSVIDGRACNGSSPMGCAGIWPVVAVGASPQALAVDTATDTIYVTNTNENTVSVIDGSHCNAGDASGCAQPPATVAVGAGPRAIGVNSATHTTYVGNSIDGTVSVVDGRTCNGQTSSGCGQSPPAVPIGSPSDAGRAVGRSIAVDRATNAVYLTSVVDSDVVTIKGAACRAGSTKGCRGTVLEQLDRRLAHQPDARSRHGNALCGR